MKKERNDLNMEFIIKRKTEFGDVKDAEPGLVVNNERIISGEET